MKHRRHLACTVALVAGFVMSPFGLDARAHANAGAFDSAEAPTCGEDAARGALRAKHAHGEEPKKDSPSLVLVRNGKPPVRVGETELAGVPKIAIAGEGEGRREAWSVREVVMRLVGPKARVVSVRGQGADRQTVERSAWDNGARTPVLRLNRRGLFKFQWVRASDGEPEERGDVRDVTSIEVTEG